MNTGRVGSIQSNVDDHKYYKEVGDEDLKVSVILQID
jgi:hypothetical protein